MRPARRVGRALFGLAAAIGTLLSATTGTQDANANGDTRTLTFLHTHTGESATITFRRNGRYDPEALNQLNWLLRDWRSDEQVKMDPRLFDIVWEVYREVGSREPVHVLSAYRSPQTNAMLRRRSRGVSEHSQHMAGKALDFRLPDVDMARVRAVAMRLQHGGVGFYPSSGFVHLDSGSVRAWPRMTQDQLARLFPDGKTVHLPPNGKPLARYEEARAEILSRGGAVGGYAGEEAAPRRSLWAMLFGGGDDEDSDYYRAAPGGRGASAPSAGNDGRVVLAYNGSDAAAAPEANATPFNFRNLWRRNAAEQKPAAAPQEPASALAAPMPPRRPDAIVLASLGPSAPLPPIRPSEFAALEALALQTASIDPQPAPDQADRAALRALFATALTAAQAAHPAPPARPAASGADPRQMISELFTGPGPTLNLKFSSLPNGDLKADRFTGPAVKFLPVVR